MKPGKIKAVFFDLDETLLDEVTAKNVAIEKLYEEIKIQNSLEDFSRRWNQGIDRFFPMFARGIISFQEQRRKRIRYSLCHDRLSDKEADKIFEIYLSSYENSWELFSDVILTLDRLNSFQLGIITNGSKLQQRKKIARLGICDHFEGIFISEEVGYSKPSPEIFKLACSTYKYSPKDCIYIGDRLETDAIPSQKVEMTGIWLNRNKKKVSNKSIATFENLDRVIEYIAKIN